MSVHCLLGHNVTERLNGDVGVLDPLERPIVLVVLHDVLKVADHGLKEIGHVILGLTVEWGAEPENMAGGSGCLKNPSGYDILNNDDSLE